MKAALKVMALHRLKGAYLASIILNSLFGVIYI